MSIGDDLDAYQAHLDREVDAAEDERRSALRYQGQQVKRGNRSPMVAITNAMQPLYNRDHWSGFCSLCESSMDEHENDCELEVLWRLLAITYTGAS